MTRAACELDWEPEEDTDVSRADSTAASLQSSMRSAMGPLLERLPQLEDRAKALTRRRETKDKASSLLADLAKERERLDRLFPSRN